MHRRHFIALAPWQAVAGALWLGAPTLAPAAMKQTAPPRPRTILVLGDSLSAEYGLKRGSGWVALLEQRLQAQQIAARVINASISGDTSSGARSRLGALLSARQPTHVVIELGGNDALRGLPLQMTQDNLTHIILAAQAAQARVLLVGMQVPPNYGQSYTRQFADMYRQIAKAQRIALVPFFLHGIADTAEAPRLFQSDRIHPNELAQPMLLDNVWPELRKQLQ